MVYDVGTKGMRGLCRLTEHFQQLLKELLNSLRAASPLFYLLHAIHLDRPFTQGQRPICDQSIRSPVPLYALIIGIDEYKSAQILNLHGAVNDADAVDEYLRTDLHVPAHQIVNLRNKGATREAFVRELRALQTRAAVNKGDSVLVFYAGYGTSVGTPDNWPTKGKKTSLIVPHDGLVDDDGGQRIHPIPARTIDALLHELSAGAEDNAECGTVTAIFDCCYSRPSMDQESNAPARHVRALKLESGEAVPADLDESIWASLSAQSQNSAARHSDPKGTGYISLSACREDGVAQEVGSRGLFTQALLETLQGVSTYKMKYSDFMERIPNIPGQTPTCDGHDLTRLLFNFLAPASNPDEERSLYEVTLKDGKIVVDAGFLQGVGPDAEFLITTDRSLATYDEIMVPKAVRASSTELMYSLHSSTHPLDLSNGTSYFAARRSIGKVAGLRLHIATSDAETERSIMEALEKVHQPRTGGPAILRVDDATLADLSLVASGADVQYIIHEPLITACGLPSLRQSTKAETKPVYSVLRGAAQFFRFLRHSPTENRLRDLVHAEVYALEIDEEGELGPDLRRPWIPCGSNVYNSGFIDVEADDDTPYGIRVQNDSDIPLHVWAFYFDCSGLAISEYYRPPVIGQQAEPSLPARGELTIGYGAGGGLPYTFFLREGQDLDIGFIKLFISTEPIDFSSIEQRSPFKDPIPRGKKKRCAEFEVGWDTVTAVVVQRSP